MHKVAKCMVQLVTMITCEYFHVKCHSITLKLALDFAAYLLAELGSLTAAALLEKVKDLQNLAYKLGIEECKYNALFFGGCWKLLLILLMLWPY